MAVSCIAQQLLTDILTSTLSIFSIICETVYQIYGKVNLLAYVNKAWLRIHMAENRNCQASQGESHAY
jgi:hypothetical protein